MSMGVFTSPIMLENVTQVFHGLGGGGPSGEGVGGVLRPSVGKHCTDLHQRPIQHGTHFVPGPDECTLCACDDGEPKWCKAVLCSPPQDCKSFRVGSSCCDFICLDDSLNNNGPNTGGPYLSRPVEIANFVPKVVIAAVTAMLSLSLLFFLIHRLRQRHIQGRMNSARARRSTQMCDECDDTRSLDFSNDFFEHRMNSPHLYPPQYLAWWKPPSSYFPPRGEAPPPYEEAMATTSIGAAMPYNNNNNNQNNNNNTSHNNPGSGGPTILNDIPIIVPPPVLPPGTVALQAAHAIAARSPAIQRLASAIASTTNSGGNTSTATTSVISLSPNNVVSRRPERGSTSIEPGASAASPSASRNKSSCSRQQAESKKSDRKSKSSRGKEKHSSHQHHNHHHHPLEQEPQPGPSRAETDEHSLRIAPPHGPAPPTYEDAIYSLHPGVNHRDYYRHSLTLPPRRYDATHLYPVVVVRTGEGGSGGHPPPGMTCYTEDEINSGRANNHHPHNQRYSLQFHIGGGGGVDPNGGAVGGDWSSSSSTLSLSTSPNSPVGRPPSLSSSSESSVSESNPPPPPAASRA